MGQHKSQWNEMKFIFFSFFFCSMPVFHSNSFNGKSKNDPKAKSIVSNQTKCKVKLLILAQVCRAEWQWLYFICINKIVVHIKQLTNNTNNNKLWKKKKIRNFHCICEYFIKGIDFKRRSNDFSSFLLLFIFIWPYTVFFCHFELLMTMLFAFCFIHFISFFLFVLYK